MEMKFNTQSAANTPLPRLDANKNGVIDKSELKNGAKKGDSFAKYLDEKFAKVDTSRDGVLGKFEINKAITDYNNSPQHSINMGIVKGLDTNKNDVVDKSEVKSSANKGNGFAKYLDEKFAKVDTSRDGVLGKYEINKASKDYYNGPQSSEIRNILRGVDANKDDVVSQSELKNGAKKGDIFAAYLDEKFAKADTSRDGVLGKYEISNALKDSESEMSDFLENMKPARKPEPAPKPETAHKPEPKRMPEVPPKSEPAPDRGPVRNP
ncbi:hypothetical protein [Vampirovibrio sp.]|uniref:hypothetical protein n=1 Tax=Vampirovibrio sp. TaxID=2717857 RepID=UPI0035946278